MSYTGPVMAQQEALYQAHKDLYDRYFKEAYGLYWRSEMQGWKQDKLATAWADANSWVAKALTSKRSPPAPKIKFFLTHIPLDSSGYTKGKYPRYYGVGPKLYMLEREDGGDVVHGLQEFRATDREAAKAIVRKTYPGARF